MNKRKEKQRRTAGAAFQNKLASGAENLPDRWFWCELDGSDRTETRGVSGSCRESNKRHAVVVVFIVSGLSCSTCTYLDDHPLHLTRNSNFPWKRSGTGRSFVNNAGETTSRSVWSCDVSRLWPFSGACLKCTPHQRPAHQRRSAPPCLPAIRILHRKTRAARSQSQAGSGIAGSVEASLQNKGSHS